MLDARFIRENPEIVKRSLKNRNNSWDYDAFIELDKKRREQIKQTEKLKAERNSKSKAIGSMINSNQDASIAEMKKAMRKLGDQINKLDTQVKETERELTARMLAIPNIPVETVPVGKDETENLEIRRWGTPRVFNFAFQAHWDLGPALGIIDFDRGVKLAHSRFSVLRGAGARMERALINFMADTHVSNGMLEWWPPALANAKTLTGTGQLPKFEEDLFKTTEGLYLIPTAEVMLTNLHADEVLEEKELPLRYCAYTPCFREEAGSAGRDTRGLIRAHQFDKVEMVRFATPKTSDAELEDMTAAAENILQLLKLPYRTVSLCTGDLGFSARQTYDIEVWLPSYDAYKEISSCSNCGDFQARRANIKYRDARGKKHFAHTLNGSGLAVGRTMAAIIENYQNADGSITVPEVLRPYMHCELITAQS